MKMYSIIHHFCKLLLAGALSGVCSLPAVGGIIDDFSDATALTTSSSFTAGSMLGGERDAIVGGSPVPSFVASGGLATFTSTGVAGGVVIAQLVYDGVDGGSGNVYGLGSVDLTDGGASDRFRLVVSAVTGEVDLLVRVWESGTAYSSYIFSSVNAPGTLEAPFASFTPFGVGGEFNSAEAVGLFVQTLDTVPGATVDSVTFDAFSTYGANGSGNGTTAPIPEPSSVVLLGLGLGACTLVARKKRRR